MIGTFLSLAGVISGGDKGHQICSFHWGAPVSGCGHRALLRNSIPVLWRCR